jgi:phospholipid/cholesterol/gamma-HCH transport system ATP-binding protein
VATRPRRGGRTLPLHDPVIAASLNTPAAAICFSDVTLARGSRVIVRDASFDLQAGSVTALLGPSGAGKSTLLYAITGELAPSSGQLRVLGESMPRPSVRELFALRRRMGVLLQGNGLLTDLSVFENVALPARVHTPLPEPVLRELVTMKLNAVGLGEAGALMPQELSGGMARRVALARALVLDPPLMLYDEPLTGLDPIAVGVILDLIRRLNDSLGLTSLIITHHVRETLEYADRAIVVANHGIAFDGTPEELTRNSDPLLRQFLDGQPDGPIGFDYRRQPAVRPRQDGARG